MTAFTPAQRAERRAAFSEALANRIHELERELDSARREAHRQRQRAELWKQRALRTLHHAHADLKGTP